MIANIVQTREMVTLLGGGKVSAADLAMARALAPVMVAADGGANTALSAGWMPDAVIGDFDSITAQARAEIPDARQHVIAEQETTDFEKCLSRIEAPLVLGLGFLGARLDHALAALVGLGRLHQRPCVLLGAEDIVFVGPPRLTLDLPLGSRLSLFPVGPVTGTSAGLKWPIAGMDFAPHVRIGTSNEVTGPVDLTFDAPRMLVILARQHLDQVVTLFHPDD